MPGPVPMTVNSITTRALLDTGSPSTIVSLKFILKVMEQERPKYESVQKWKEAVKVKIEVELKNYGGAELDLVGQMQVQITIQVHKERPVDLLLGTDLQPALGFYLVQAGEDAKGTPARWTVERPNYPATQNKEADTPATSTFP